MELKNILKFTLVIVVVGMLVGVGVLSLDKFGEAVGESTIITNESFIVPIVNGSVSLANENLILFSSVINSTGFTWGSGNYTVDLESGILTNIGNSGACSNGSTCYANYVYSDYDNKPYEAIGSSRDAVGEISITWMSLIVTIGILAIIIGLVIAGFYLDDKR